MTDVALVAYAASSPLGEGEAAVLAPEHAVHARDAELTDAGLLRPFAARVKTALPPSDRDRATLLLARAIATCARELDVAFPEWRTRRVGAAIGTSSGGMRTFERDFAKTALSLEGTYLGPVVAAERPVAFEPFSLILGACASSTIALGLARAWLLRDRCDLVLAGGFDAISTFVAAGFESLRATAGERGPRPFREGRDGLVLGEGAALVALARARDLTTPARWYLRGFGASCDAVHLTAPDRTGGGLARAATAAIAEAGAPAIALVSAHGTATEFNDAAEALAIAACANEAPIHALKGAIGHTLGAAGALELLSAINALDRGVLPSSIGEGKAIAPVLDQPATTEGRTVLKLSSAFGGTNAALVASRDAGSAPTSGERAVYLTRASFVATPRDSAALAQATGYAEDKIARADDLVRLALTAVLDLEKREGSLRGAGIIVGLGLATIDTNARFLERLRERGAARGEPRRFPYTTPNAAGGECAVAFGLTGPMFAVGGGPHGGIEALMVAADLVAASVADRMVVVAVDEAGEGSLRVAPETKRGAVALLVSKEPSAARLMEIAVHLSPKSQNEAADDRALAALATRPLVMPFVMEVERDSTAHTALTPLARGRPEMLEVKLPWGFAKARLSWL